MKKLASAAKVSDDNAHDWPISKQCDRSICPATLIQRPIFDEDQPNAMHKADLLYLPHDKVGRKTYKYAMTVVDVT